MGQTISYTPLQMAFKYSRYFLTATNGKGHGVHSPFVFDFIVHVLNDRKTIPPAAIEKLRKELLKDDTVLSITDYGAGSGTSVSTKKRIGDIAATSLKPKKYASLLYRIVNYYKATTVVELGTSLGITTAHLASGPNAMVYTLEGDPAVAEIAERNFNTLGLVNISLIRGNFDETLSSLLQQIQPDVVFIDGNHRYEPTIRYFRQIMAVSKSDTIIILDDIHWSAEMEKVWTDIKNDPAVLQTIDLFFIGILLFRKEFKVKQHYSIRF